MTDFETRLRADLADAAEQAPEFSGLGHTVRAARRRRSRWVAGIPAAAAAVLIGVAGVAWLAVDRSPGRTGTGAGEASCAALLEFEGRTYVGHGEPLRRPRPGRLLGTGTAGCGGADLEVRALPGVDPTVAVLTDEGLYVSGAVRSLPARVAELDRPVRCTGSGTSSVTGDWVSMEGPMPARDNELTPPYVAVLKVGRGDWLPRDRWETVTIRVRVTAGTSGGTDPSLAEYALRGSEPVTATVHCDGGDWVADSLVRG